MYVYIKSVRFYDDRTLNHYEELFGFEYIYWRSGECISTWGGGSLGAFGCGVYKALAKSNIKLDIIAGTSIGGVNAAIIAGSKNEKPEKALEEFWLEIGENSINDVNTYFNASSLFIDYYLSFSYLPTIEKYSMFS